MPFMIRYSYSALKSWYSQLDLPHCAINWKNNGKKQKKTRTKILYQKQLENDGVSTEERKEFTVEMICGEDKF